MTLTPSAPAVAVAPVEPIHPAKRVEYRDSDHSYRVRHDCTTCETTGRVPGAREGTTKKCGACKGEGAKFLRVPSVSTVLSELAKPALVPWAARTGADALIAFLRERGADAFTVFEHELEELHALVCNAHREVKDEAADAGTSVHDWITTLGNEILTAPLPDDPTIRPAVEAFVTWFRSTGYTIVDAERIVVDAKERYAGRFDLLVRDRRGRLLVLDIKTSNSVYLEHVLQLAGYARALRDEIGETISGTIVVWCHKDGRPVRTVERTARQYRGDFHIFAALLGVYEHRKTLGSELRRLAKESAADAAIADATSELNDIFATA